MKTLVVADHLASDPDRVSFYRQPGYFLCPARFRQRNRLTMLLDALVAGIKATWHAWKRDTDVVVVCGQKLGLAVCLMFRFLVVRRRVVIYGFNALRPYRGVLRLLYRFAITDRVVVIAYSRHESEVYADDLGLPRSRFRFAHYCGPYLNDARFAILQAEPKSGYVVVPGSYGRDFGLVADVARLLPEQRFVVVAYHSAVAGICFPSNVELRNGISEVEYCRLIALAAVCFVPVANMTTANGHIAIVQAMCMRTLLFTNVTPGTRDYLLSGENCVVYSDRAPRAVASQLSSILHSSSGTRTIVDAAYRYASEHFGVRAQLGLFAQLERGQSIEKVE